jgi:hypothetical protein
MLASSRKETIVPEPGGPRADWVGATHATLLPLVAIGAVVVLVLPTALELGLPWLGLDGRDQILLAASTLWVVAAGLVLAASIVRLRARRAQSAGSASNSGASSSGVTVIETLPPGEADATPAREPDAGVATTDAAAPPVGPANRYQILRELGRGGMGVVYHALDTVLQREVALKELPLHLGGRSDIAGRFRQEARVVAKLSHPYIVQVYDLIEDGGRLWIALEFIRGGTLTDRMRHAGGALGWPEAARIGLQITEGLGFAHALGVIHRDIKPMNVLLTDARPPVAKLTDFGLARLAESSEHTQPGSILGSAYYMSPEQVAGKPADARSDLYSLGVTFFEMLTGRVPFDGEFAAVLARQVNEPAPDVLMIAPDVPPELASLVASLLAKSPEDRPQSANHVVIALRALVAGRDEPRQAA